MLNTQDRIFVAGHNGMVGSALLRQLENSGFRQVITRSRNELDLTEQAAVRRFFTEEKIDVVFLAAARVGGINANNTYRADFIYENLMIEANVIHQAFAAGVRRLLFLGSSCIYPRAVAQPMSEEALLTGPLEPTNEPYAVAKISGIKMCEAYNTQHRTDFRAVMPTNLFGPNDNYDLEGSHVLPAIIRKLHLARKACDGDMDAILKDQQVHGRISEDVRIDLDALLEEHGHAALFKTAAGDRPQRPGITMWGSGKPLREFLHVDDMAAACLYVMQLEEDVFVQMMAEAGISFLNVGAGREIAIQDLVSQVADVVGYSGNIRWDDSRPDGILRKLLDTTRLEKLGWQPAITLTEGIRRVYKAYCQH